MGYLKDLTGDFTAGLLLLAGCAVTGAAIVVCLRIDARREQLSGGVALANQQIVGLLRIGMPVIVDASGKACK